MYVRHGARLHKLLAAAPLSLVALVGVAVVTELLDPPEAHDDVVAALYLGVLSTAMTIFLVFRFNGSYARWWESRKLWGALINASRDLARQALTLLPAGDGPHPGERVVRLQVAYAHALHAHLLDDERRSEVMAPALQRLLPDEAGELGALDHVPNALIQRQAHVVREALPGDAEGAVLLTRFDETFRKLQDVQGGCERIRNTPFPDQVGLLTRILVWGFVVVLMLATIGPDGRGGFVNETLAVLMAVGFLAIDGISRALSDPFADTPSRTATASLATVIERDLLELLGDPDRPEPAEPVDGVLL